ncbi:MAG TPA: hypothetical protein VLA37_13915 [Sphingomonadaceae bacterium]|nr:hypothetical protein [Sphingomonadaceae bacterium]
MSELPRPERRSDCSRCAALCCIAYPAEEMPGFSASKNAGEPCPKLDACGRCTIYDRREEEGFAGCIQYECFGAGQHVVQHLFGGKDWRDDPALLEPMIESFLAVRKACDLLFIVDYAREHCASPGRESLLHDAETALIEFASTREGAADPARLKQIEPVLHELVREAGYRPQFSPAGRP